jgi:hypothetical protein
MIILNSTLNKEKISRNHLNKLTLQKVKLYKKVNINVSFLKKILNEKNLKIDNQIIDKIKKYNLSFHYLQKNYENKFNIKLFKIILSNQLSVSGIHKSKNKKSAWEKGWSENLKNFNENDISTLYPAYFRKKNNYFRFNGKVIFSRKKNFENYFAELIHSIVVKKYLRKIKNIYEFGAGSGKVISSLMLNIKDNIEFFASDWTNNSINILKRITINKKKINPFKFNFFFPNNKKKIIKQSMLITNGALEQTGINYKKFIFYLLKQKPYIVINFEPMDDIYNNNNINDFVLKLYAKNRNYLQGYVNFLKILESKNKIKILKITRLFGGPCHEGNSFIVWKPL